MSPLAVVTILIGSRHRNIAKVSHPTQKEYAHKIGADYVVFDGGKYNVYPANQKQYKIKSSLPAVNTSNFNLSKPAFGSYNKLNLVELFSYYKRILYIDTDILIRDDSPSLFEIVPEDKAGMLNESEFIYNERARLMDMWAKKFNFDYNLWNGKYYGGGVFLISESQKNILQKPKEFYDDKFYEQTLLNWNIVNYSISMYDIPYKFNRVTYMDLPLMESRLSSYFIHYAGSWMQLKEGHSEEASFLIKLMLHDLEKWKAGTPNHEYKKIEKYIPRSYWVRD